MKTFKELKEEYKQLMFKMGVYQIRNLVNNKVFIGSSKDLTAAWNAQQFQLNLGSHRNKTLQEDWNRFGADKFIYEILEELTFAEDKPVDVDSELNVLEAMVLEEIQPYNDKGYNRIKKPY